MRIKFRQSCGWTFRANWRGAALGLLTSLGCTGNVWAQATVPPSADARTESPSSGSEPALPRVDDPMLAAPKPALHVVATWQEALAALRRGSTSLKAARARIDQARAQTRVALAPALPSLVGTGAINQHLLRGEAPAGVLPNGTLVAGGPAPNPAFSWNAALSLNVPLLNSRSWYDYGTAQQAVQVSALDAAEVERQQIGLVASALLGVVTSERLAEVSRVALASALSTVSLTRRRAALGAANAVDVLRVEQEVSDSRAQVVAARENLMRARELLGDALGASEPWGVAPQIQLNGLVSDARARCTATDSLEQRPDVRAASAAEEVARRNVNAVDYSFVPTVDASSTLAYWSSSRLTQNFEHVTWTIGGLLTWELYDGGLRYATRAARRAERELSHQHQADVRRHAQFEVAQALRGVEVANANLAVSTRGREIANETARLTQVAYVNGTGTSFDLVDAARRLRAAELDFAIKEFDVLRAEIAALLALATCHV